MKNDNFRACSSSRWILAKAVQIQRTHNRSRPLPKPRHGCRGHFRRSKHWYRTHEMALKLLCQFKCGLKIADIPPYFAHVNSAKCCQNKKNKGQADRTLFDECRRFIPKELRILKPDIVVTQGNWAKVAICKSFTVQKHVKCSIEKCRQIRKGTLTTRPASSNLSRVGAPSGFRPTTPTPSGTSIRSTKHCWPLYAKAVGQWMGPSWPETR